MWPEFEQYLPFWIEGQQRGYAGDLPRMKLPNGSKMVALHSHPLLYVDNWFGVDSGGGQTTLYTLTEEWNSTKPTEITGSPIARLAYSGQVRRLDNELAKEHFRKTFGEEPTSEAVWKFLKSALSRVSEERPLRGPNVHFNPKDAKGNHLFYRSHEMPDMARVGTQPWEDLIWIHGEESIEFVDTKMPGVAREYFKLFNGVYDFTLIKKNLEDPLP